ncbi:MAG: sulfatase [Planctomycetota bacterium]
MKRPVLLMGSTKRSHKLDVVAVLASVLLPLVSSCWGHSDERGRVTRLVDLFETAQIEIPALEPGAFDSEKFCELQVLDERFEAGGSESGGEVAWFTLQSFLAREPLLIQPGASAVAGRGPSSQALRLPKASVGAVCFVPADPLACYEISVWCRRTSEEGLPPGLGVFHLTKGPMAREVGGAAAARSLGADEAVALWDSRTLRRELRQAADSTKGVDQHGFARVQLRVGPLAERRGLLVILQAGSGADFDDLRVRRLTLLEEALDVTFKAGERFDRPIRTKVSMRESMRDCLLLPPPAAVSMRVGVPSGRPFLELSLGVKARNQGARVRFRLEIAGSTLLDEALETEPPYATSGFQDRCIDLEKWAGETVKLRITTELVRGSEPLAVVAHPILRQRGCEDLPLNLVLVSLDTLRADHLSCYGYPLETSPHIDALAARGVRFAGVYSPSSYTLPTHVTMLSGQHPLVHGVRQPLHRIADEATSLLAEELRERGYLTAAFTGGGFVDPEFGFDAGFDRYDTWDPGLAVTPARQDRLARELRPRFEGIADGAHVVRDWIRDHADSPFFLFVHTFLVHNYTPDPSYWEKFNDVPGRGVFADAPAVLRPVQDGEREADAELRDHLRSLYDATILQADDIIVGALVQELERSGLMDRTVFCIVADHGEELFEHGSIGHGKTLYNEVVRVPWILSWPGGPRGEVIEQPVPLESVAPTLRSLLGLPADPGADGRPIAVGKDALPGGPFVLDLVAAEEQGPLVGLVAPPWKILVGGATEAGVQTGGAGGDEEIRLFDLSDDPGEHADLASSRAEPRDRLLRLLRARVDSLDAKARAAGRTATTTSVLSVEVRDRLEELGYLGR